MSISGLDIKGTPSYDPFIYIKETLQQLIDENMDLSPIRELLINIYNNDNLKYNNFDIMYNMNDEDLLRYIILRISCINEKDRDLLLSKAREIIKQHYTDSRNLEDYVTWDWVEYSNGQVYAIPKKPLTKLTRMTKVMSLKYDSGDYAISLSPEEMCRVLNGKQTIIVRRTILKEMLEPTGAERQ